MDAESYDSWYRTRRGRWIGECETRLILESLQPRPGEDLLDVGCGTGYFTRELGRMVNGRTIGLDVNPDWVRYARRHESGSTQYLAADALAIPFRDDSFDLVVSIAAVCFMSDEVAALQEILRVCRRRFAIGLLNRHSLLYRDKGRNGGSGGYRGAHWHTPQEARALFNGLPVQQLQCTTAIQFPSGGLLARTLESAFPSSLPFGAFILVSGEVESTK